MHFPVADPQPPRYRWLFVAIAIVHKSCISWTCPVAGIKILKSAAIWSLFTEIQVNKHEHTQQKMQAKTSK